MSNGRYKIFEGDRYPYFVTCSVIFGLPIFSNAKAVNIIMENLTFLHMERGIKIYAYVIMENHLHVILQGDELEKRIREFRSYSARKIIDLLKTEGHSIWLDRLSTLKPQKKIDRSYQFWKRGFHPKQLFNEGVMYQKIEYIHNNPVKRGYVERPEQWKYSSVHDYLGRKSSVPISQYF